MKSHERGIILFGIIEIAIGFFTLLTVIISLLLGKSTKPLAVLIFVLTASIISLSLGVGIIRRNLASYNLLIFFATVIILSKILIFLGIINLSGALETSIPTPFKNIISICYHALLIWYFTCPSVKMQFGEKRDALFSLKIPFSKCRITKP